MPANYPPVTNAGEQLAGMGTPDLEGTFGTFTFYTDDPLDIARDGARRPHRAGTADERCASFSR